jgi:hypothetical protein
VRVGGMAAASGLFAWWSGQMGSNLLCQKQTRFFCETIASARRDLKCQRRRIYEM